MFFSEGQWDYGWYLFFLILSNIGTVYHEYVLLSYSGKQ